MLVVTLGEEYHLSVAYGGFYHHFLNANECDLHRYQHGLASSHDQFLFPTKILKRNAIDLSYYWFELQTHMSTARAPPKLEQVFEDIKQEFTYWERPQMSARFLMELKLDGIGGCHTPTQCTACQCTSYSQCSKSPCCC